LSVVVFFSFFVGFFEMGTEMRINQSQLIVLLLLVLSLLPACHLQPRPAKEPVDQTKEVALEAKRVKKAKHREDQSVATEVLHSETGIASFYGKNDGFQGRLTANGEVYDKNELTAAHRDYPFDSIVRVTNLGNDKSVKVRINDRGPAIEERIIDLSYAAARQLEFVSDGLSEVRIERIE